MKIKSWISLLTAIVMLLGCMMPAIAEEVAAEETTSTPLVVAYSPFSEKFSPFFYETAYDGDVVSLTQAGLMTIDRAGGIVYNGIEGETRAYNGKDYTYYGAADLSVSYDEATDVTTYTAKLRDDMKFSDGEPVTADDLIFTYYVYLDTAYVGSTTLNTYDIIGLQDYRTQTTSSVYDKYSAIVNDIYAAGADHEWTESDAWTQEQQTWFWDNLKAVWTEDNGAIVSYVVANYLSDDYAGTIGSTAAEIGENEGLQVAFGMAMWGFAAIDEATGKLVGAATGTEWDLANGEYPTLDDYYAETYAKYEGDPEAYFSVEAADDTDVLGTAKEQFIGYWGPLDDSMGGEGVPNIAGIKKLDDYTVEVKTNGYEAPAVYTILGVSITPLHYYGDEALYDYENNMFGFPRGDLSAVQAKTTQPMGAGPYKFVKYENRTVYFEANEHYFLGAPKTQYVQFKETQSAEVATGIATGTVDAGELSGSRTRFEEVAGYNDNGEITGNVITTSKVDNRGYGYIGLNAVNVNVGGELDSEASKALRKGLATVLAVYRDVAFDSYYGEAASVIHYPISNTSWAAPQPTDEDYKVAFSVDVDGNDIYTSEMTPEEKYAAALQACVGYLKAAGYTWDDAAGKFTAAPEGAKMAYEVIIPADGTGDHPSFAILTDAQTALASIGIELKINDPADSNVLWDSIDANTHELWCAAWSSGVDPDMYQVYHSANGIGLGGTDSNNYNIADPALDDLIIEGRQSDDQSYRKAIYKQALDIIVDWAVEIPAYQRQNCIVFSSERIDMDTMTPDITTNYGWMSEIENIEMVANQAEAAE